MTKMLGLLRHAKSEWDDDVVRDFDRGVNARGRRGAAMMGAHIRDKEVAWDAIHASSAERVRQTIASALPDARPRFTESLYLATFETIIELLRAEGGTADRVLVVGHNPGLYETVIRLVPPEAENALFDEAVTKFPTCSFALLECAIDDWSELASGKGKLIHFVRPRDLDPALGPDG